MKSIKTNPNSAKGPDKGKIVNKLYCILLTTLELTWLYFFLKKNRHEVHYFSLQFKKRYHLAFSPEKKEYIKNYDAILLSKYDSAEKID